MGLFSGISKAIGSIAGSKTLGSLGTIFGNPLVGMGVSALGTMYQNSQAKKAAQTQMNFQERMSNSSYQRAMQDMKLAGLNPILAYSQGGASTPGGTSYSPSNIGSSAISGGVQSLTAKNIAEQNNNLRSNSALQAEQGRRLRMENDAYSILSPEMRLLVMSGGDVGGSALAISRGLKGIKKAFSKPVPIKNRYIFMN